MNRPVGLRSAKAAKLSQTVTIDSDVNSSLIEGLELFRGVCSTDFQKLLQGCERRDLEEGELLLSPGTANESVFVVLSGSVNVHVGSPDAPVLATMDVGACVGEMSIIEDRDPSAFVIAAEASHLLVIHQAILWEMVDVSHQFTKNLLIVLSERVRSHNHAIAEGYGELRKYEQHARTDALTGLSNRHAMEETFLREIKRCEQDEQPISLVMIDIDNFKTFNDHFGHIAGDRVLKAVARILENQFRPRDLIVRYGGDEFAVLLPGLDETAALAVADRVRKAVCGTTGDGSDSLIRIPIKISLGVAQLESSADLTTLIRAADAALYRAKHAGRDKVSS